MKFSATPSIQNLGRVHFIGIGGAGMSAIARILLARSIPVSGSDARDSDALRQLAGLGATVHVGHSAEYAAAADTVVVSTAIREDNPEFRAASEAGLPIIHRSQALAAAMEGKQIIAVAGTHGKTTTTAMITVMLHEAGLDPSFAVGGDVAALGVNAAHGEGRFFVAEADESDGSFLNYRPAIAVVTNVEPDHLDYYGSASALYSAFDGFVDRLPASGTLIACADDAGAMQLVERMHDRFSDGDAAPGVLTYGYSDSADVRITAKSAKDRSSTSILEFQVDGSAVQQPLPLTVPGRHNVLNAAAAFAVGLRAGVGPGAAASGLAAFSGASRRFEFKGEANGVRVFDDYAHHPTEVLAALTAARTVAGGNRVHVLFQPHLFSRTREFAPEFASALGLADTVSVLDIYPAREDPIEGVTSRLITDRIGDDAYQPDAGGAAANVAARADPGDIILTVGAGDVTLYGPEILANLGKGTEADSGN
ncbi:UDP-N-acetylmuramate--L-alanine ligase [Arthrobacter sp. H14]|uniref:UDP-N-acetylmuramate--L-alanine ligase n=1 Tax=Arthrobacter sp. H14 TaxID=1312959 RepID=UPI00047A96F0|nr:UDP-N-acetylmuramate--L-alanine ligase [Arthrobacter sp. H14]